MDYKKVYYNIIENRKNAPLLNEEYGEIHHIIPRSLGGGDENDNLIKLTAREHFICHALLSEMYEFESYEWYKMNHAFMMMKSESVNHQRYINSRLYEIKKKDFSKVMSYNQSGKRNSQYGVSKSEETKNKIKESIHKTLGITDGLTHRDRKKLKSSIDREKHTINGIFINKQRRNTIYKVFGIQLHNRCKDGFSELTELLKKLYVDENKSTLLIADMFNTNDETIRNYLSFIGIDRKSLSEAIKNYNKQV